MHAQDIDSEINMQRKKIKQVTAHVERARENLEKRNSEMAGLLGQYRQVSNCCKDIGLFICLLVLVGCNVAVLKFKGVF